MNEEYNGWANYPTWVVSLHIFNTEGLAEGFKADLSPEWNRAELKQLVDNWVYDGKELPLLTKDLLGFALDEVEWDEIIEALQEDF